MNRSYRLGLLAVFTSALVARATRADTHRIAIVVGNNQGDTANPALHYAEEDAAKLSQALHELGGIDTPDLYLLRGRSIEAIRSAFASAARRIAAWRTHGDGKVVLLFYFSGHSDGEVLELGGDRLGFSELRRELAATRADVRVAIVDSCKSGALLEAKGGKPGAGFQIRLSDNVATSGEALLTSSAVNELALESKEIRGSFFTHHFVSGLRGAADASADGRVTLSEAYQYAFAHTVAATAATILGPQHPTYDYRLAGEGELVLATVARPSASLEIPTGFDRVLVVEVAHDLVLAEVPQGAAQRIAVTPGSYTLRAWRNGRSYAATIDVGAGEARVVRGSELAAVQLAKTASKGDEVAPVDPGPTKRLDVLLAGGAQRGIGVPVSPSVLVAMRSVGSTGWSAAFNAATAEGTGFRETAAVVLGGYYLAADLGALRVKLGGHGGGGVVTQHVDGVGRRSSPIAVVAPWLNVSFGLNRYVSVAVEATLSTAWLRRDSASAIALLPSGWFCLVAHL